MEQFSADRLKELMGAEETKQLIALLQKSGGNEWAKAAAAIRCGNYAEAKEAIQPLLTNSRAADLVKELNSRFG